LLELGRLTLPTLGALAPQSLRKIRVPKPAGRGEFRRGGFAGENFLYLGSRQAALVGVP
jgi:hypothetical protein